VKIGALAEATGVTATAIRYYEQIGLLEEPKRTESGYRDYDEAARIRLQFIKAAQSAGLTLTETRGIFDVRDSGDPPCDHVARLIDQKRADISERIKALKRTQRELERVAARADALSPSSCPPGAICHIIDPDTPIEGRPQLPTRAE
jgi:DNA-binding transcriptional MerR regulator